MPEKIVECIPNFSEGRRMEVIEAIQKSIASVEGAYVLDRHIDPDHNRTVITFAGGPESAAEAAFAAIALAAKHIDLDRHEGQHPRIGATDVVPFVPLMGVTMEECAEVARRLGQRVGEELGIPVYLYERAATRPERVNLENIRRGEYEALKEAIQSDPDRAPDFGPSHLGSAGATVIGARPPLIAYNVFLTTDEVDIARRIARAIRHSSGGLRFVKALGMLVEGQAQVSMNLTDFTKTPVARVMELIRKEAARYGVAVDRSELVGLIPQAAVVGAAQWYLQLDRLEAGQILETRLYSALEHQQNFLERLAAGTPTPGGGSAAAYAASIAAALVSMVARLTLGKKQYRDVAPRMEEIADAAERLRKSLQEEVARDSNAFDQVLAAYRLPKKDKKQAEVRASKIEQAIHRAAAVPLEVAGKVVSVMELACEAAEAGNLNAISDAGSAGFMAKAAFQSASLNVRANAGSARDRQAAKAWLEELDRLSSRAFRLEERLAKAINDRA